MLLAPPQVRWSAGAVPPLPTEDAAWRLSLDVAPVLEPGETEDVVGDVFCAAANAGLFVHTLEGRRVLFDVTPAEAARRCKRIPLLPRRTYHVALVRARRGPGSRSTAGGCGRPDARASQGVEATATQEEIRRVRAPPRATRSHAPLPRAPLPQPSARVCLAGRR